MELKLDNKTGFKDKQIPKSTDDFKMTSRNLGNILLDFEIGKTTMDQIYHNILSLTNKNYIQKWHE